MSPDANSVSVEPSSVTAVVPVTGGGGETIPQVGASPARTETERILVKATVNMNRFMKLAPYLPLNV